MSELLFVIAGSGGGTTTASALQILKPHFVDGLELHKVIATTLTRPAAVVLLSRIIERVG